MNEDTQRQKQENATGMRPRCGVILFVLLWTLTACGGVTPGSDPVKCVCLFGLIVYNVDICTDDDIPPDHPAYGGSRVHNSCAFKCGEEFGVPIAGASPSHFSTTDIDCRAGASAREDPLLASNGPNALNFTFRPSLSRVILRRDGRFGFVNISKAELAIDLPRGAPPGVAGLPVKLKKIWLEGDFSGSFDSHTLTNLLFTLADGAVPSTTTGEQGQGHFAETNSFTIPSGVDVLFSGKVDGTVYHVTGQTPAPQMIHFLRTGSTGSGPWQAFYKGVIPIPETDYEVAMELVFDWPFVSLQVANMEVEAISPMTRRVTAHLDRVPDAYHWYHPTTGVLLSELPNPIFDLTNLGADCVKFWAWDYSANFGQSETVCLNEQGCTGVCAPPPVVGATCADGTEENDYGLMVGCAGTERWEDAAELCGAQSHVCSADEWKSLRGGGIPNYTYWTSDNLNWYGQGTQSCGVSLTTGQSCGNTPMRVCTSWGADALGNQCNWHGCGLDSTTANDYFGGCLGNTTAGALCCPGPRATCADGTVEDDFGGMVGCAGATSFDTADSLCGAGSHVCSATEWTVLRGATAPSAHYWTSDSLRYSGVGSGNCAASRLNGNSCGANTPMRVCAPSQSDSQGNRCNWYNCGYDTTASNDFFGGCNGNTTAGALCCPD